MYRHRFVILFLLSLFFHEFSYGQIKDDTVIVTKVNGGKLGRYFHSIGFSVLTDYSIPPPIVRKYISPNGSGNDTLTYYIKRFTLNLLSITYEARCNLYDFNDRMSVSASVPFTFGFGPAEPNGLCTFTFPAIVDFNYGNHSTFNNIDDIGFHAGLGYDLLLTPLFEMEREIYKDYKRVWGSPMMRAGFKFPYHRWNAYVNAQMTLPRKYYDEEEKRYFKSHLHFKITFGVLLGYD